MKDTPGLHRAYRSQSSSSTAIVPPRRYSIERLNHLGRRFTGGLDIGKVNHAAIQGKPRRYCEFWTTKADIVFQAGVLKRQIALPYVTFMDGPLSELPTNYRHGLATVSTEMRRRADDWVLLQDNNNPQLNGSHSIANNHSLTKQNEGFAKFLKRHSSPTHQRVTAGGRIVPMEATPPPQLKPLTKYSGAEDPIKRNTKSFFAGQNYLPSQGHIGTRSNSVGGTTNEQIRRNMATHSRVSPFGIGSPSQDHNHSVSSPRIGIGHTTAPSLNTTPWWLQYNPEQQNFGGVPAISPAPQMTLYPMSLYPSVSQQGNHLTNTSDKANGSGLLNVSTNLMHDSNPAYSNSTFSPGLVAHAFPNLPQLSQTPGPGLMYVPFPPAGDGAGSSHRATPAKPELQGISASHHLMPPESKAVPVTNTSPCIQANTPFPSLVATPTTIEQAREAYEAITERIEQFNREMVLQNPALDDVQQEAIAKYRLDMATERARTHKLLKTLEREVKKTASHSSRSSSDANRDEVETRSKVQFRLPSNSPSRGLNADAPVWQPSKKTKDPTPLGHSPSISPATKEEDYRNALLSVTRESQSLNTRIDDPKATVVAGASKGVVFHELHESSCAQIDKKIPRLAGVGPLGSAGYPIPELLSAENSHGDTPDRLCVWVDESGRRTDELPLHILEHCNKELEERIRAGKAGEKPNFDHLEKPSDYDYYVNFKPIDVVGWILTSGHFGVRKDLREELASEPEGKRSRGPDIRDWRDWRNVQEWDQRFDAARHCHGVESPVWTEKHGWIICTGEDRQPPDANDDKWMTEYERMYWIRKPDSVFSKLNPNDPRIEYMENTCDECSRWSINDNATVYTDE
ncbi:MAG: hypothetical protein Q9160_001634 [Pyrenula sp. 1 TL-2023]